LADRLNLSGGLVALTAGIMVGSRAEGVNDTPTTATGLPITLSGQELQ
jgi:hypothetical protein